MFVIELLGRALYCVRVMTTGIMACPLPGALCAVPDTDVLKDSALAEESHWSFDTPLS
jgi:hypothetical protein